ncbi:AtpZ/AtpI family protein [Candidatus Bandiella euplotis]|uniref:ATPase n=1 Tax=Candidatus Bandiella euplotis TaxID=1664265 RepID=A0ABZ0UN63_9RICK|nr:AtpZ/AtpI family protein [Candidatus Bandiella woodruffii]WPX97147.1 ATPase [Candidatus Bandiella woodruffii]
MEKSRLKIKLEELKSQVAPKRPSHKKRNDGIIIVAELLAGIFIGAFLGYHSDKSMGTSPLFLFLFTVFGLFAALLNISRNTH